MMRSRSLSNVSSSTLSGLFSVFFAFLGILVKDGGTVTKQGYFHGYSPFVWLIATMQVTQY